MSTDKSAYISAEIEAKWQEFWDTNKTFKTGEDQNKSKFYALDMFPYPSGAGLHVGHPEGYIASDIISRYKRMNDFNVLHPMGWDAFGLPAEQYAVETGTHPKITTKKNIETFKRQIKSLGFSYDWDREINTTDEKYYKWTQWIFTQLYKKGLAYIDNVEVNWCPALGTVLANEEVIDGLSERGSHPVVRKPMKQWVLKITEYADRLLDDIDDLDWPTGIKEMQRNWIGKSIGAEVDFKIKNTNHKLTVYTTRPDTLFGATYMVMSPEHPLVKEIMSGAQSSKVEEYIEKASTKSELARTEDKEKTGVFTGAYALNPVNEEEIPIWISDYVLISYGTGAIMAVPAHDTRDFEFAQKFDITIKCIIEPNTKEAKANNADTAKILAEEVCWTGNGKMINSANSANLNINNMEVKESKKTTIDWLAKRSLGREAVNFKLRDWIFSRQRYWGEPFPIAHMEDGSIKVIDEKDLPVILPEMGEDYKPSDSGESPLAKATDWLNYTDPKTGLKGRRETNTMPQWAGSCWYYLRYIDNENNEQGWAPDKEKYWMPVDLYIGGAEHAVLHLLYARFWHKVLFDLGFVSTKEPFQKLFNQGMILGLSYRDKRGVLIPNDKVKNDKGRFLHTETGEELEEFPAKMSKSLKNVVNPDEIIAQYGADSMRLYEMFMGPLEATKPWNTNGVEGVARFLQKAWRMIIGKDGKPAEKFNDAEMTEEHNRLLHQTIKKVTEDIETFNFNTGISQMMIFVNEVSKANSFSIDGIQSFIKLLSPYAPHLCEELWERFGYSNGISYEPWPKFDEQYLQVSEVEILIQLLGKPVAKIIVPAEIDKESLEKLALGNSNVKEKIAGKTVRKIIVVPGRLVNIVAN